MPGLVQRNGQQFGNGCRIAPALSGSVSEVGIWTRHHADVTFDQLQKFWNELSPQARQQLLRIDKQTLFEQARKNLYCSRCNGLLLEGFSQIVMYGRSLQHEDFFDEIQDPSVHPWGGLAATRDGVLTLLDCLLNAKSLTLLQNVFDCARARERERELLYPDACGGEGRGWISQGLVTYGRGHGSRETCALHTARLSCDTLVDFWSALGEETRQSLLRLKEEDFIERLMYRFDSKRFCRDCRRNVVREFKELKELKRMRREPRCTSWFCVADTAFQYEVSDNAVQADWHQSFVDTAGSYHHFEWAVGTGEGKADILDFKDVGMNECVQETGLNLNGLSSCYITLRAWKLDGRCTELSVKAHALKGQPCVHRRLIVGDGYVTITKGESIRRFFEHAEEAEEEEDDDSMDKDVNDSDEDGSRPQKHAKSPELAREFLLDAATVIFKDQVEKAFREGTARQNAHSIIVCLALELLEDRVHVACKEIITLEKQIKLLEEEEKEKVEEEARKERKRTKEREKKLRRKERLRRKDKRSAKPELLPCNFDSTGKDNSISDPDESHNSSSISSNLVCEPGENGSSSASVDELPSDFTELRQESPKGYSTLHGHDLYRGDGNFIVRDRNVTAMVELSKYSHRKLRFRKDLVTDPASRWGEKKNRFVGQEIYFQNGTLESKYHGSASTRSFNGLQKHQRKSALKYDVHTCGHRFAEKFNCSNNRIHDRLDIHSCGCEQQNIYRPKDELRSGVVRSDNDYKHDGKVDAISDAPPKPSNGCYAYNKGSIPRIKHKIPPKRGEIMHAKKVWEPLDTRKKVSKDSSHPDYSPACRGEDKIQNFGKICQSFVDNHSSELTLSLGKVDGSTNDHNEVSSGNSSSSSQEDGFEDILLDMAKNSNTSVESLATEKSDLCSNVPSPDQSVVVSSSDSYSSCLSEGDSAAGSLGTPNEEFCTSDSEGTSQNSEGRETISTCTESPNHTCLTDGRRKETVTSKDDESVQAHTTPVKSSLKSVHNPENGRIKVTMSSEQYQPMPVHNQTLEMPVLPAHSTMGYYHQTPAAWLGNSTSPMVPYPHPSHFFTGSFAYGVPANQSSHFCIPYGSALQPFSASVVNMHHPSLYQTDDKVSPGGLDGPREKMRAQAEKQQVNLDGENHCLDAETRGRSLPKKIFPSNCILKKATLSQRNEKTSVSLEKSPNFSLFHFGGPVAISRDENNQHQCVNPAGNSVKSDSSINETSIEEYSLFAAGSVSGFPFF